MREGKAGQLNLLGKPVTEVTETHKEDVTEATDDREKQDEDDDLCASGEGWKPREETPEERANREHPPAMPPAGYLPFPKKDKHRINPKTKDRIPICPNCGGDGWSWSGGENRVHWQDPEFEKFYHEQAKDAAPYQRLKFKGVEIFDHWSAYTEGHMFCCNCRTIEFRNTNGTYAPCKFYLPYDPRNPLKNADPRYPDEVELDNEEARRMAVLAAMPSGELAKRFIEGDGNPEMEGDAWRFEFMHEINRRGFELLKALGWPTELEAFYMNKWTGCIEPLRDVLYERLCKHSEAEFWAVIEHWKPYDKAEAVEITKKYWLRELRSRPSADAHEKKGKPSKYQKKRWAEAEIALNKIAMGIYDPLKQREEDIAQDLVLSLISSMTYSTQPPPADIARAGL